jgi:hypothetical protein
VTAKTARDLTAEITYLTRALKAPALRDAAGRLGERARKTSQELKCQAASEDSR